MQGVLARHAAYVSAGNPDVGTQAAGTAPRWVHDILLCFPLPSSTLAPPHTFHLMSTHTLTTVLARFVHVWTVMHRSALSGVHAVRTWWPCALSFHPHYTTLWHGCWPARCPRVWRVSHS